MFNKLIMFSKEVRVYYDNTDAEGIVYHSKYLDICERIRTDFLREKRIIQSKLFEEQGICFVVRNINIQYIKPAKFDDLLNVSVKIIENNGLIIKMEQEIKLIERNEIKINNELLTKLVLEIVMINKNNHIIRIPKNIMEILK